MTRPEPFARQLIASMNAPQRVTVVRPHRGWSEWVGDLVVQTIVVLINAWLVMLTIPNVFHNLHPSYGATVSFLVVVRLVQGRTPDWMYWTVEGAKKVKR